MRRREVSLWVVFQAHPLSNQTSLCGVSKNECFERNKSLMSKYINVTSWIIDKCSFQTNDFSKTTFAVLCRKVWLGDSITYKSNGHKNKFVLAFQFDYNPFSVMPLTTLFWNKATRIFFLFFFLFCGLINHVHEKMYRYDCM